MRWSSSVELGDRPVDFQGKVLQVARDAYRPGAVAEVALDLAQDGRHREAREGEPAVEVEAVDGVDEAQARDLEEVIEGLLGALVAACQLARQRQEALDEHLAIDRVALIEVAREQRAILLGAAIAHADSPGGVPTGSCHARSAAADVSRQALPVCRCSTCRLEGRSPIADRVASAAQTAAPVEPAQLNRSSTGAAGATKSAAIRRVARAGERHEQCRPWSP